jgi:hypothetical protein
MNKIVWIRIALQLVVILSIPESAFSQRADSTKVISNFLGVVSLTNKGISTIPNLTLGKPAIIFDLAIGRKLTFEPQFRFALEGKPWSILFWGRYKLLTTQKFKLNVGAHPALSFNPTCIKSNIIITHPILYDFYFHFSGNTDFIMSFI